MRAGVPSARGVDLNLDEFSLSEAGAYAGDLQAAEANAPIGAAFWSSIDSENEAVFKDQDAKLFNATLRENIGYGRVGATDAEILEAARLAEANAEVARKLADAKALQH